MKFSVGGREQNIFRLIVSFRPAWFTSLFPLWYSLLVSAVDIKTAHEKLIQLHLCITLLKGSGITYPSSVYRCCKFSFSVLQCSFVIRYLTPCDKCRKKLCSEGLSEIEFDLFFISEQMVVFKNYFAGSFKFLFNLITHTFHASVSVAFFFLSVFPFLLRLILVSVKVYGCGDASAIQHHSQLPQKGFSHDCNSLGPCFCSLLPPSVWIQHYRWASV